MSGQQLAMWMVVCGWAAAGLGCRTTGENRVLHLDGRASCLRVKDDEALRLARGSFTLAGWIRLDALTDTNNAIMVKRGPDERDGWTLYVAGRSWQLLAGKIVFHLSRGDNPFAVSNATLKAGEWYHVCLIYDAAARETRLYLDGQLDSTTPDMPRGNPLTDADLYIGRDSVTARYYFHGMMDEVCIFERTLDEQEVDFLANHTLVGDEYGLIAYWSFDRGSGRDLSGSRFHAKLIKDQP